MTMTARALEFDRDTRRGQRPPVWLFVATAGLGVFVLTLALAETNLWLHYLIDAGEYFSLLGLVFILFAGIGLHRQGRLVPSLPLVAPWLLFPLITQGDQIIDNLSINTMRIVTHLLLAAIFATPVGVVVVAARSALLSRRASVRSRWLGAVPGLRALAEGRAREGTAMLAASLLVCEIWLAVEYLGVLMVAALIAMTVGVLLWGSLTPSASAATASMRRAGMQRSALTALLAGVIVSLGLFVGFKNRPGAYQGSPSFLMDPDQETSGYRMDRIAVPAGAIVLPPAHEPLRVAFTGYGRTLRRLLDGYYILDRNYTWHFHNELFLRNTPLVPNYRAVALQTIAAASAMKVDADTAAASGRAALTDDNPLAAFLDEVQAYVSFNFDRAARIGSMSAEFERSPAGLQHAAHLYEGEGKVLGMVLSDILTKHRHAIESPVGSDVTRQFAVDARDIFRAYAGRIVGF